MTNLTLTFDNKNIIIPDSNKYCCNEGVIIRFDLEKGILGNLYECTISNIGRGSIKTKPEKFKFNFNKRVEKFAIFAELNGSRVNLIKVTITNLSDPTDSVEDIVYIECGSLQKIDCHIPEEQLNIKCGLDDSGNTQYNSIIAQVDNLVLSERYRYSFAEQSVIKYETLAAESQVNILQSNGNKYIFNGNTIYNKDLKYVVGNGTFVLKNIPQEHPIAILNAGIAEIAYSGDEDKRLGEKEVDGNIYDFYYGDVTVTITGDYGQASIYCIHHGYMGGQNLFVYQKPSSSVSFSPSEGVLFANRNQQNINSILTYSGIESEFVITLSITDEFNNFVLDKNFTVKCS